MTTPIAYLGPVGTHAEWATLHYAQWLQQSTGGEVQLQPYPSIAQTLRAAAQGEVVWAVAPVENSVEGSVAVTLDMLWQLDQLQIQQALVLPIAHALISTAPDLAAITVVYSHPQALAQCQIWLETHLPQAKLVPTNSTAEALQRLETHTAAIASQRAAQLYQRPILAFPINDYPDNCTRFWVVGLQPSPGGSHSSLAFSMRQNIPGALVQPLQVFAQQGINLSRIESRPTKRSLGDYLFFLDLEANLLLPEAAPLLDQLARNTETLKLLGSYDIQVITAAASEALAIDLAAMT
ncbi:prephenate dehydratase [Trichothermofontia sp.]